MGYTIYDIPYMGLYMGHMGFHPHTPWPKPRNVHLPGAASSSSMSSWCTMPAYSSRCDAASSAKGTDRRTPASSHASAPACVACRIARAARSLHQKSYRQPVTLAFSPLAFATHHPRWHCLPAEPHEVLQASFRPNLPAFT